MSLKALIKGVSLWSLAGFVHEQDVLIADGRLARIGRGLAAGGAAVIDGRGWVALPGLVDLHAHLGEPGREDRETLEAGLLSAAWGGFTAVLAMPDADPPLDSETGVGYVLRRGGVARGARIMVCAAATKARSGKELAELGRLKAAGAVAAGDAKPMSDAAIVRRLLEYASMLDMPVMIEARNEGLSSGGVAHEGTVAGWLGLAGIPASAEWVALARDLLLAEEAGGRLHVQGVSTERSVALIDEAKARGVRVTAECGFHHLIMDDGALLDYGTNKKLMPPLRPKRDVEALIEGVKSGVVDCIVTDHTPLTPEEKHVEFDYAPFGAAGFESALPAIHTRLVRPGLLSWSELVNAASLGPRTVLGMDHPQFNEGERCDMLLFNPEPEYVLDPGPWKSKARNTPFSGMRVTGRVEGVFLEDQLFGPLGSEVGA